MEIERRRKEMQPLEPVRQMARRLLQLQRETRRSALQKQLGQPHQGYLPMLLYCL